MKALILDLLAMYAERKRAQQDELWRMELEAAEQEVCYYTRRAIILRAALAGRAMRVGK